MRVVLDTNILVSRLIVPRGKPAKIVARWEAGVFDLLVSGAILEECRRVLGYNRLRRRHGRDDQAIAQFIAGLRSFAVVVEPQLAVQVVERDPDDDKFIACAVAGSAEFIVTGDRHLLDLGSYQGIHILPPAASWHISTPPRCAEGFRGRFFPGSPILVVPYPKRQRR